MNLTDFRKTSLRAAFQAVERECRHLGVKILDSEIVGLVPQAAWDEDVPGDLQLRNWAPDRILETRLAQEDLFSH
jgi:glutamate formiminotransferase